jgi:hypothetical protein
MIEDFTISEVAIKALPSTIRSEQSDQLGRSCDERTTPPGVDFRTRFGAYAIPSEGWHAWPLRKHLWQLSLEQTATTPTPAVAAW